MMDPIHYDPRSGEYYVWLCRMGIKYMKYFRTAERAIDFAHKNPRICMEVPKGEAIADLRVANRPAETDVAEDAACLSLEAASLVERVTLKKQRPFWGVLFLCSIVIALCTTWLQNELSGDLFAHVVPSIVGQATGMVAIPGLLVGGIVLLKRLFGSSTSNITVFILAGIIWFLAVSANLRVAWYEASVGEMTQHLERKND